MRKKIGLMICDLDNTLYDWVTIFSKAFYAMVDAAVPILETEREQLLDDLQKIHVRYHNTEHPFALLETKIATRKFPGLNSAELYEKLSGAFHAFNSERRLLRLYPGVRETLNIAKECGCLIVGHTEATLANATFRLDALELTNMLTRLYAVECPNIEHPTKDATPTAAAVSEVRILALHERKPDPRIMLEICATTGISPAETLYVGDSITRDIGMANAVGAHSAWAKYGTKYEITAWESLVRVTHWSPEDVARAKSANALYENTKPSVTLEESMEELLNHYQFFRRHESPYSSSSRTEVINEH